MSDKASLQRICCCSHGRCYLFTSEYTVAVEHKAHPVIERLWYAPSLRAAACMSRADLLVQALNLALVVDLINTFETTLMEPEVSRLNSSQFQQTLLIVQALHTPACKP